MLLSILGEHGTRSRMVLDMVLDYNLIQIKEGDKVIMTFSTASSYYEYFILPYGLATGPSVYQAYINKVLREFLGRSTSFDRHVHDVCTVLRALLHNQLYFMLEKCEFHSTEVSFLGYIIWEGSVYMQGGAGGGGDWTAEIPDVSLAPVVPVECQSQLTFEEWRHQLEGAWHPLMVIPDQKNLEYIQTAKRFNSWQGRWPLFFSWFVFWITFRWEETNMGVDVEAVHHQDTVH
ncbi:hypothetical protein P4O66_015475 [Electrophorus voltai]|uniref:ribonuclease H n=1 Tax=Electrophorus voltai TaxID=2609070 RepID=A0AAD9DNT2_9TELE|nr:hypothetical protein P4O66_015475 [Electrophorus voltai]